MNAPIRLLLALAVSIVPAAQRGAAQTADTPRVPREVPRKPDTTYVPLPSVQGPIASASGSHPFLAAAHDEPALDLSSAGYVEEEFFVSGSANVYDWAGDGALTVRTANAPYTTRILVRRPANAARFSGTVVVEPMFAARRWDWSMMWGYSHEYLMDRGDAWVGITMPGAVSGLQKFDAARYASLSFKNPANAPCPSAAAGVANAVEEGLRWDAISQVGALLKQGGARRPFAGFRVSALILTMQGGDLTTYMMAIHPRARMNANASIYDGYVAKAPFNLARINQCAAAPAAADPRQIVHGIGVPVIAVAAEGEVLTTYPWRRADSDAPADRYRLYEVAGAGHIDKSAYFGFPSMADQEKAGNAQGTPSWPFAAPCDPAIPLMDTPMMSVAFNAAFSNLDAWIRRGTTPPHAPRMEIVDQGTPQARVAADDLGHGRGGFRTPYVEAPLASYATSSPGPGNCREMGHKVPLERARLEQLHGNPLAYAAKAAAAIERLSKEGWLTAVDARRVTAELARIEWPK